MNPIPEQWMLVIAIVGAAIVHIIMGWPMTIMRAVVTFFVSVYLAAFFTAPVMRHFELHPEWEIPVAASIAFFGSYLLKHLMFLAKSPDKVKGVVKELFEIIKIWRAR